MILKRFLCNYTSWSQQLSIAEPSNLVVWDRFDLVYCGRERAFIFFHLLACNYMVNCFCSDLSTTKLHYHSLLGWIFKLGIRHNCKLIDCEIFFQLNVPKFVHFTRRISIKECCRNKWGSKPTSDHQSDAHLTEPPRPAQSSIKKKVVSNS